MRIVTSRTTIRVFMSQCSLELCGFSIRFIRFNLNLKADKLYTKIMPLTCINQRLEYWVHVCTYLIAREVELTMNKSATV